MKSFINRYVTVAENFEGTTLTPEELDARRSKAKTERGHRVRRNAIKGSGALLLTALAVSGVPKQGFNAGTDSVASGVTTAKTEIATDVKLFGQSTTDTLGSVVAPVGDVFDAAQNQVDKLLSSQEDMTAGQYRSEGLRKTDQEALGAQAKEVMEMGDQIKAGNDLPPSAFTAKP